MSVATRMVELFGGAMRVCLPSSMVDVSDFRQVPDNQEVYADADTGASVIVELLGRQRDVSNSDAATFFYYDLAKDNGCPVEQISGARFATLAASDYPHLSTLPPAAAAASSSPPSSPSCGAAQRCDYACLATGLQRISKFANEAGKENEVFVGLAVLRFTPPVSTDILVSLSCPTHVHPESSEARVVKRLLSAEERLNILQRAVASLEVVEWGLFVPEE